MARMATADVSHEPPDGANTHVNESTRATASEPLHGRVAWYSGYRQAGIAPAIHRGLPSPYMTLIFTLDDPLHIAEHADPSQAADSYDALLGGLHASRALITHTGRQSGIQAAVSPLASRALFGVPAGELAWIDVHADDALGRETERIRERMREAATWPERFAAVDAALRRLLATPNLPAATAPAVPDEVARAWQLLLKSHGMIPISALADEVGWSTRHLATRFRTEIGLTPKAAARVIRFDRTRRLITSDSGGTLAELAVRCGYFDQAHLDREFRLLAGCSPTKWLADEGDAFRNVQVDVSRAA
jgi:AraC-like DNA-binding protein